ncbi:MAG: glycosyltransferase family 2 protein [Eubacterium sp.]
MLGIIIINFNKYEKTVDCIKSIFDTVKSDYKIYLLDNCSANNSFEILNNLYKDDPRVEMIESKENLGYARGNNLCLEKAEKDGCEYVLISNNDIVYKENAVEILLDVIKSGEYLLVGPRSYSPDGRIQSSVKKNKPTFSEYMKFSTYLSNLVPKNQAKVFYKNLQPKEFSQVYWVCGSSFIADMKKFKEIGYFDPYTFLYFEEYIISEKAVKSGMKIAFEPKAQVIHFHGASTGGAANLFTRTENFKSECYMFAKYQKLPYNKLKNLRSIRCLEVLFSFTKEGKIKDAMTFIKQSKKILKQAKEFY